MIESERDLEYIAFLRGDLYGMLALGFSPPTLSSLSLLEKDFILKLKEAKEIFLSVFFEKGTRKFQTFFRKNKNKSRDKLVMELSLEYNRLFVGPYHPKALPYESVYRGDYLMGKETLDVLEFYRKSNLEISPEFKDLPDHIAAELEFMKYLCIEEGGAFKSNLEKAFEFLMREESFLSKHLSLWIGDFCRRIASSTTEFYLSLAEIAPRFISLDKTYVSSLAFELGRMEIKK
ncbi:MAG: molecular chaperone [Candidatus Methanofastidiosia archaeon]